MKAGVDEQRVDGGIRGRRLFPYLHAQRAEVGPASRRIACEDSAADEEQRLAARVPLHPRQQVAQHPQAGGGLPFVIEGRAGDLGHQHRPAVGASGLEPAFPRDHRVERGSAAQRDVPRRVDDFARPQLELPEPRTIPLADDVAERPEHRGMVERGRKVGAVRIGGEPDVVVVLQPLDELRDALNHLARPGCVEADAVDRQHDHALRRGRCRAAARRRRTFVVRIGADLFCRDDPSPLAVDRDGEFLGS